MRFAYLSQGKLYTKSGDEPDIEVLAKAVLSFDLSPQGGLLFTNGYSVFSLLPDGRKTRLHKGSMIQQVVALPPALISKNKAASDAALIPAGEMDLL